MKISVPFFHPGVCNYLKIISHLSLLPLIGHKNEEKFTLLKFHPNSEVLVISLAIFWRYCYLFGWYNFCGGHLKQILTDFGQFSSFKLNNYLFCYQVGCKESNQTQKWNYMTFLWQFNRFFKVNGKNCYLEEQYFQ